MKMLIKGNPEFVNKLRTVVEKISEESFVDVEYCDNESNSISFYGWVECKEVFSKLNVYKFQCDVFWINGDDKISALDRSELKKYQNKYMSLKQWMAVKQINVFLMELDNYEKRIIVSYYPRNLQIKELHKAGTTILLVEQNARKALQVADRAYVLETGNITLSGTGAELASSDAVKKAYLGG